MNFYQDEQDRQDTADEAQGENTMAVLSTLGGAEGDDLAESERLGLDPEAGKAKITGSTLAVGVVVVLGAVVVFGMKMTLGALGAGTDPIDAMAQIDGFIATHNAALSTGNAGPIKPRDEESQKVLDELKQDPTDHQVPAEEVAVNPFDISNVVAQPTESQATGTRPQADPRALAMERAKKAVSKFKVDAIAGDVVFIDGEKYRVGDLIGETGFALSKVEGLTCILRTTDQYNFAFRLRYR